MGVYTIDSIPELKIIRKDRPQFNGQKNGSFLGLNRRFERGGKNDMFEVRVNQDAGLEKIISRIKTSEHLLPEDKVELQQMVELSYPKLKSNDERHEFLQHMSLLVTLRENDNLKNGRIGKITTGEQRNKELLQSLAREALTGTKERAVKIEVPKGKSYAEYRKQ